MRLLPPPSGTPMRSAVPGLAKRESAVIVPKRPVVIISAWGGGWGGGGGGWEGRAEGVAVGGRGGGARSGVGVGKGLGVGRGRGIRWVV